MGSTIQKMTHIASLFVFFILTGFWTTCWAKSNSNDSKSSLKIVDQKILLALENSSNITNIDDLISQRENICTTNKTSCLNIHTWLKMVTSHASLSHISVSIRLILSVLKFVKDDNDLLFLWNQLTTVHKNALTAPKLELALAILSQGNNAPYSSEYKNIFNWYVKSCITLVKARSKKDSSHGSHDCLESFYKIEEKKPTNYLFLSTGTKEFWAHLKKENYSTSRPDLERSSKLLKKYITYSYYLGERNHVIALYKSNIDLLSMGPQDISLLEVVCTSYRYIGHPQSCLELIDAHPNIKNSPTLQIELAITQLKMGAPKQSLATLELLKSKKLQSLDSWLDYYSAYAYYARNEYKKADEVLENIKKTNVVPLQNYAILKIKILARQNKFSEANILYEEALASSRAVTLEPYHDIYLLKMSYLISLLLAKDIQNTKKFLTETSLLNHSQDPTILYYLTLYSLARAKIEGTLVEVEKSKLLNMRGSKDPDSIEFLRLLQ